MLGAPAVGAILGGVHHQHRPPRRTRQQSLQGCVHEPLQTQSYCRIRTQPLRADNSSSTQLHHSPGYACCNTIVSAYRFRLWYGERVHDDEAALVRLGGQRAAQPCLPHLIAPSLQLGQSV